MQKKLLALLVATGFSATMVGCSTHPDEAPTVDGVAIDYYLKDALVFADKLPGNGVLDDDEPFTYTDANGKWEFTGDNANALLALGTDYEFVTKGGTDIATGKPFVGLMKAPAGAEVITPITSLKVELKNAGVPEAEIASTVETITGLPAAKQDIDPVTDADAMKAVQKVALVVNTLTKTTSGASTDTETLQGTQKTVYASLAKVVKDKKDNNALNEVKIDDTSTSTAGLTKLMEETVDQVIVEVNKTATTKIDTNDSSTQTAIAEMKKSVNSIVDEVKQVETATFTAVASTATDAEKKAAFETALKAIVQKGDTDADTFASTTKQTISVVTATVTTVTKVEDTKAKAETDKKAETDSDFKKPEPIVYDTSGTTAAAGSTEGL